MFFLHQRQATALLLLIIWAGVGFGAGLFLIAIDAGGRY